MLNFALLTWDVIVSKSNRLLPATTLLFCTFPDFCIFTLNYTNPVLHFPQCAILQGSGHPPAWEIGDSASWFTTFGARTWGSIGRRNPRDFVEMLKGKQTLGYVWLGQNNHWHAQDVWLEAGLVGEITGHPGWVVISTGVRKSQNWGSNLGWT